MQQETLPEVEKAEQLVSLKAIQAPILDDLKVFRSTFQASMRSDSWLLSQVVRYVLKQKGKQIRPTLVLLTARMLGETGDKSYRAAALIELLHTATLIHDDVVDEADKRRGVFSINALWKNKVGVLLGDYLLSRGLLLALDHHDYTSLHLLSDAVRRMSEGELLQIEKARKLDIDEATYFRIISDKTASLIAACTACGAASVVDDQHTIDRLRIVGENLGLAFQIRDDLFDFGTDNVGKPIGIDLQEKKLTLPLIHALDQSPAIERRKIFKIIRKPKKNGQDLKDVNAFVVRHGGIVYAQERMRTYANKARTILLEFPDSIYRQALLDLVQFTVQRRK